MRLNGQVGAAGRSQEQEGGDDRRRLTSSQIHGSVVHGSVPLKPYAQATGDGARARIDVVVDPVQPRGRIHTAVAGDGECVLYGGVEAHQLTPVGEVVGERDVVHPEKGRFLHVQVREVLRGREAGLEDRRVQIVRGAPSHLLVATQVRRHVVVHVVPEPRPQREIQVEVVVAQVGGVPQDPFRRGIVERPEALGIAARGDGVGQADILALHGLPVLILLLTDEE